MTTSDHMLTSAFDSDDALYWKVDKTPPTSPKCKQVQVDKETLDDLVLMIKTVPSTKEAVKSTLKSSPLARGGVLPPSQRLVDTQTISSQTTSLSQLTKQVLEIKASHQAMLEHFDKLAAQMAVLINNSSTTTFPNKCHARGQESGNKP